MGSIILVASKTITFNFEHDVQGMLNLELDSSVDGFVMYEGSSHIFLVSSSGLSKRFFSGTFGSGIVRMSTGSSLLRSSDQPRHTLFTRIAVRMTTSMASLAFEAAKSLCQPPKRVLRPS